jgi:hypothetical protein
MWWSTWEQLLAGLLNKVQTSPPCTILMHLGPVEAILDSSLSQGLRPSFEWRALSNCCWTFIKRQNLKDLRNFVLSSQTQHVWVPVSEFLLYKGRSRTVLSSESKKVSREKINQNFMIWRSWKALGRSRLWSLHLNHKWMMVYHP